MLTSKFKVSFTLKSPKASTKEDWYSSLKDIYGIEGPNFDGYVSSVEFVSEFTLIIECYTLEGPEETSRLSELKDKVVNFEQVTWEEYKKAAVASAILIHALRMGYILETYTIESIPL